MKRILLTVSLLFGLVLLIFAQSQIQSTIAYLPNLSVGVMNPSYNEGKVITYNTLNSVYLLYPGNDQEGIDIGNVVFYYGYNSNKRCYDGLMGVDSDQETINGYPIYDENGNVQFNSIGEMVTEKMTYNTKITILGKIDVSTNYLTIAIRYESSEQINIFFYNYNQSGTLLSCFLAACNEKENIWETKGGVASNHSLMTATINSDKTVSIFTDGDFMINRKIQLTSDGRFRIIEEKVTEYPD